MKSRGQKSRLYRTIKRRGNEAFGPEDLGGQNSPALSKSWGEKRKKVRRDDGKNQEGWDYTRQNSGKGKNFGSKMGAKNRKNQSKVFVFQQRKVRIGGYRGGELLTKDCCKKGRIFPTLTKRLWNSQEPRPEVETKYDAWEKDCMKKGEAKRLGKPP